MDIGNIYKKSWEITKKQKALWVIGMAVVLFVGQAGTNMNFPSGGGSSSSSSSSSSESRTLDSIRPQEDTGTGEPNRLPLDYTSELQKPFESNIPSEMSVPPLPKNGLLPDNPLPPTDGVPDTPWSFLGAYLLDIARDVPVTSWAIFIISIVIAMIVGWIIRIIARNWARGSLIGGIDQAIQTDNEFVPLVAASRRGKRSFRELLWIDLIPGLFISFLVLTLLVCSAAVVLLGMGSGSGWYFLFLFIVPAFLVVFVLAFGISIVQLWAQRFIVMEGKPAKEAFFAGYHFFFHHFAETAIMGICNYLLSCGIGCVSLLLLGIAAGIAAISFLISPAVGIMVMVPLGTIFLAGLLLYILFAGMYMVFNYSTWTILFHDLKKVEGESHAG